MTKIEFIQNQAGNVYCEALQLLIQGEKQFEAETCTELREGMARDCIRHAVILADELEKCGWSFDPEKKGPVDPLDIGFPKPEGTEAKP